MFIEKINIKETSKADLRNVASLWNNGEVMFYVGFPEGLGITLDELEKKWLPWAINKPKRCHYSIYTEDECYCGEGFYDVDEISGLSSLDIKLLPSAQGKGIAYRSLKYVIKKAFLEGGAKAVYVDPHPENKRAWVLYEKLGFKSKPRPPFLEEGETYLEITYGEWLLDK